MTALATPAWQAPPRELRAAADRVDCWWLVDVDAAAARRAARCLLARYLAIAPAQLALCTTATGKPCLEARHGCDLRFSLAHSGGSALFAVRLGHEVGADLERIRAGVDAEAVAATLFPPEIRAAWRCGLAAGRRDAFFEAWVRLEALAKAGGRGIAAADPLAPAGRFSCRALPAPAGFAAAVASEGHDWSLACRVAQPD